MCVNPKFKSLTIEKYNQFVSRSDFENGQAIEINCGNCYECLTHKVNKKLSLWLLHIDDYIKQKKDFHCYFITLTYNDQNVNLPKQQNFKYEVQKMLKRWRRNYKLQNLKYICTTEFGSNTGRIHHHLFIISESDFLPKTFGGKNINGFYYYQNKNISWPFGFHSITKINTDDYKGINKTLKYVLKYVYKFPLSLMTSSKIGKDAVDRIVNDKGCYVFNGYIYKSPWHNNEYPNIKKMSDSLKFSKIKKSKIQKPYLDLSDKKDIKEW